MPVAFLSELKRVLDSARGWQSGDLMLLAALDENFQRLLADPSAKGLDPPVHAALRALGETLPELLSDDQAWLVRLDEFAASLERAEEPPQKPAPEPEPEMDGFYPVGYFDHIIEDAKMLRQLCDEVKEHMDLAQFTLVDLEFDSTNFENINKIFRAFHTIKSSAAFLGLKNLEEAAHAIEDLMVLVRDGVLPITKDLINVIFFGVGFLKDLVGVIEAVDYQRDPLIESYRRIDIHPSVAVFRKIHDDHGTRKIGEILKEQGLLDSAAIASILDSQRSSSRRFGEIAVEQNLISEDELKAVLQRQGGSRRASFVKVSNERLNSLIDIVGELVVNQSMLRQTLKGPASAEAGERAFAQLESITTNIKNLVLSMGMVPIAEIFSKLRVVVRNTAAELGKTVNAEFFGSETELDRNVIENIYDPLVHMVRNAVDHGLESAPARKAAGKPAVGSLIVSAEHRGNAIEISVADDGAGIARDAVVGKAVSKGLITAEQGAVLSEREVFNLLFLPGFSTKEQATEVSGRGVGMDVVKQNVEAIRGKVEVQSEPGKGSKFVLRIPLTLAIIDGFVTLVGGTKYVLPFNLIERIIVPEPEQISRLEDGQALLLEGDSYTPIIDAAAVFGHSAESGRIVVILGYEQGRYGVAVDAVLGKQEIVIKVLNEALSHLRVYSGGTIFGDGTIGFVVDVEQFIAAAQQLKGVKV